VLKGVEEKKMYKSIKVEQRVYDALIRMKGKYMLDTGMNISFSELLCDLIIESKEE